MIAFTIPGRPIPQGGMTAFARGNKVVVANKSSDRLKNWRALVTLTASSHFPAPLSGPVCVSVEFVFDRPKSHFRSGRFSDELKDSAPRWHVQLPDGDKLLRAALDAMSTVVFEDDKQVCEVVLRKRWAHSGEAPHTHVQIDDLTDIEGGELEAS